jgi:hypothetical protein
MTLTTGARVGPTPAPPTAQPADPPAEVSRQRMNPVSRTAVDRAGDTRRRVTTGR